MKELTIGQLARQAQVSVETVRYYERRGLLPAPPRRASGYRQYSPQDVAYLQFIRRAKTLGFSLTEIADLLALRVDPETTCGDVRAQAARKLTDVDAKIRALARIKGALTHLIATCSREGPMSACPILEVLDTQGPQEGSRVGG
jgi:Hg(II)-responsive transcriptional regulator